jgi:S-phase kinase-associated protein 1
VGITIEASCLIETDLPVPVSRDVVAQVSKEGDVYEVPISVAKMSTLVATTIDDDAEEDDEVREIPLPNVKDAVLTKVIEYCTHYKEEPMTPIQTPLKSSKIEDLVQPWYAEFVKVEQVLLFELVTAANFMDIKPLLDLTCLAVSVLIKVRIMDSSLAVVGCWQSNIYLISLSFSLTII